MFGAALATGLTTGLSPAQQVDISKYYGPDNRPQQDNTILYIAIIAAVLVAAGTIYFVSR
jgi:hypothetical protein